MSQTGMRGYWVYHIPDAPVSSFVPLWFGGGCAVVHFGIAYAPISKRGGRGCSALLSYWLLERCPFAEAYGRYMRDDCVHLHESINGGKSGLQKK